MLFQMSCSKIAHGAQSRSRSPESGTAEEELQDERDLFAVGSILSCLVVISVAPYKNRWDDSKSRSICALRKTMVHRLLLKPDASARHVEGSAPQKITINIIPCALRDVK